MSRRKEPELAIIICAVCLEPFIADLSDPLTVPKIIEEAKRVGLKLRGGDFVCDACEERL